MEVGDQGPAAQVRAIYHDHTITREFGDIGYHLLIDRDGTIYEGRSSGSDPVPVFGGGLQESLQMNNAAHVAGFNAGNVGVCLLGDFTSAPATRDAQDSLVQVLAILCAVCELDPLGRTDYVNPISGAAKQVTPSPDTATGEPPSAPATGSTRYSRSCVPASPTARVPRKCADDPFVIASGPDDCRRRATQSSATCLVVNDRVVAPPSGSDQLPAPGRTQMWRPEQQERPAQRSRPAKTSDVASIMTSGEPGRTTASTRLHFWNTVFEFRMFRHAVPYRLRPGRFWAPGPPQLGRRWLEVLARAAGPSRLLRGRGTVERTAEQLGARPRGGLRAHGRVVDGMHPNVSYTNRAASGAGSLITESTVASARHHGSPSIVLNQRAC
jgi:N-acetylmuramoyl-L-alanine amidase